MDLTIATEPVWPTTRYDAVNHGTALLQVVTGIGAGLTLQGCTIGCIQVENTERRIARVIRTLIMRFLDVLAMGEKPWIAWENYPTGFGCCFQRCVFTNGIGPHGSFRNGTERCAS